MAETPTPTHAAAQHAAAATWQTDYKTVQLNGVDFAYLELGQGPLVLCLHGFPDTPLGFANLIPRLAAAGYRVIAPYNRGNSPSGEAADDDYGPLALGRDALAFIEHFTASSAEQARIIGHDWGAVAAYAAAALDPARLEQMVVVAVPHLRAGRNALGWYAMVALFQIGPLADRLVRQGWFVDQIYRAASPHWAFTAADTAPIKAVLARDPHPVLGVYRSIARAIRQGKSSADLRLLVKQVTVPTLAVAGDADGGVPYRVFTRMAPYVDAGFELVTFKDAGHFPHRERPADFAKAVLAFFATPPVR